MTYRPYARYKPSGIEWLGDVPQHWVTPPLYTRYSVDLGKMLNEDRITGDYLLCFLRNVDVQWDRINFDDLPEMDVLPGERGRYTVHGGDLLVCEGGEVGRSAIVPATVTDCAYQKALHRLRPARKDEVPRFMFYVLSWASHQGVFIAEGNPNTIPHLTGEKLRRYRFPAPPVEEQRAIADFLDAQTAKLDALVGKKRTLVERLKEKRTALISRTVTRGLPPDAARAAGLDPHPKLKPSGIDWLGDVPEHLDVRPLGYLVRFRGGATPDKGKPEYWDGDIPWVSPKDMKRPRIADAEDHVSADGLTNSPLSMVPVGAVLIVVRGMILAHSFPVALTEEPLTINQDMKALLCGPRLLSVFLYWALAGLSRAFVALAEESAHGTRKLETETLAKFRLLVPPLTEQRLIADYLDRETAKIDQMIAKVETAIERLQEHRAALITAAVTGKIDVREVATVAEHPGPQAATEADRQNIPNTV